MKPIAPQPDGPITKALIDAVAMRRQMLDAGHPADEVDYLVGQGLKAVLGNKRSEPWRFYCDLCRDTGWVEIPPNPEERARLESMYGSVDQAQPLYNPCGQYCKWTIREREKRRKITNPDGGFGGEDDFAAAGQMKPKRGFSKFGK